MVDVQSVFKKYNINPNGSIHRSIEGIGTDISESSDPLVKSNQIICKLGGTAIGNSTEASITAKCMVEQAILFTLQGRTFDPKQAMEHAAIKIADMKVKYPYFFVMEESSMDAVMKSKRGSDDKKARALEIFEANRGKKASDVAKLIQVELGITFANAYYYVSRVFK
jgi:hypothetical protein